MGCICCCLAPELHPEEIKCRSTGWLSTFRIENLDTDYDDLCFLNCNTAGKVIFTDRGVHVSRWCCACACSCCSDDDGGGGDDDQHPLFIRWEDVEYVGHEWHKHPDPFNSRMSQGRSVLRDHFLVVTFKQPRHTSVNGDDKSAVAAAAITFKYLMVKMHVNDRDAVIKCFEDWQKKHHKKLQRRSSFVDRSPDDDDDDEVEQETAGKMKIVVDPKTGVPMAQMVR